MPTSTVDLAPRPSLIPVTLPLPSHCPPVPLWSMAPSRDSPRQLSIEGAFDFEQFLRPHVPWQPTWSLSEVFGAHGYSYVGRAFAESEHLFRCQRNADASPCLVKVVTGMELKVNKLLLSTLATDRRQLNTPILAIHDVPESNDALLVMSKWEDSWFAKEITNPLDIITQLAHGLSFLHSLGIAHLDIHEQNVVAQNGRYSFLDFGSSLLWNRENDPHPPLVQNIRTALWSIAPDYRAGKPFDPFRFDVWALGNLFSKIIKKSGSAPQAVQCLIDEMGAEDPMLRPTAAAIVPRILSSQT